MSKDKSPGAYDKIKSKYNWQIAKYEKQAIKRIVCNWSFGNVYTQI